MKKFAKFILPVLALILVSAVLAIPSFAADNVLFIADAGTGDGSSAASPLGNAAGYNATTGPADNYHKSAIYQALSKLAETGGTIVIVGPTTIEYAPNSDTADSVAAKASGNWRSPEVAAGKTITFTSLYDGKDYRADGAMLIYSIMYNNPRVHLRAESVWENMTIQVLYDSDYYPATPYIAFCGYKTVIGEGVNCVQSNKGVTTTTANRYPMLIAGNIWTATGPTDLTVNSGTWYTAYASVQFGGTNIPALQTGDANLVINGGTFTGPIYGMSTSITSGGENPEACRIDGNLNITINGGELAYIMMGRTGFAKSDAVYTLKINGGTFNAGYGILFWGNGGNPFPAGANKGTRILDFSGLTEAQFNAPVHTAKISDAVTPIAFSAGFQVSAENAAFPGAGTNGESGFDQIIGPAASGETTTAPATDTTAPATDTTAAGSDTTAPATDTTAATTAPTTTATPTTTAAPTTTGSGTGAPATSATTVTVLAIMALASIAVAGTVIAAKKRED